MKTLLFAAIFCLLATASFAVTSFAPNSSNSLTGAASYCQGATVSPIVFTYNTCNAGVGAATGVSLTASWYRNVTGATTGGTFVTSTSVACATTSTGTVTYSPPTSTAGTVYYYCVLTWAGSGTCRGTGTLTSATAARIDVVSAPGSITGASTVCTGQSVTLSNSVAGGTWSAGSAIATVNTAGRVTGVAAGSVTITYSTGCGSNALHSVTVNTTPAAISGPADVCQHTSATLSDSVTGGSWSSSNASVASINATTGSVYGVALGAVSISYTLSGCTVGMPFYVVDNPVVAVTGGNEVCQWSVLSLGGSPAGGIWSVDLPALATVESTGDVTGIAAGAAIVSYTVVNGCGTVTDTQRVTIVPLPLVDIISGATSVCPGATTTLTDTTAGGVWSSSDTSVATISGTGIVTGVTSGATTISYTKTTTCGTDYGFVDFLVNDVVTVDTIGGAAMLCQGATAIYTNATSGGVWVSSNTGIVSVDASGTAVAVDTGTVTLSYTVTGTCGSATAAFPVVVTGTPATLPAISHPAVICSASTVLCTNTVSGGTWSSSDPAIASIAAATGSLSALATGGATITYTYTTYCGTVYTTSNITVSTMPDTPGTISGSASICAGASAIYTDTTAGGTWASSNNAIASINAAGMATGVAAGTVTLFYTVTNGCGSAAATTNLIVNGTPPAPAAISGTDTVCAGASVTLNDTTAGGSWSSSTTSVASVSTTGVVSGVGAGTAIITYGVTNICGTSYDTMLLTVNASPTAPAGIAGATDICIGASTTLSDLTTGGTWSTSDATVASVHVSGGSVTGLATGAATITYTISNECGTNFATLNMNVHTSPDTPATITGLTSLCVAATTTLASTTTSGSWSTSNASVATVDAGGNISGVAPGSAVITYTVSNACGSTFTTTNINVSSLPVTPAPIAGTLVACEATSVTLTDTTTGGSWSSGTSSVATIDAGGVVTALTAGTSVISYTKNNGCGSVSATATFTVNSAPAAIGGATFVCTGATTMLTNTVAGGTWSRTNGTGTANITSGGLVNGVTAGTFTVSYTLGSCRVTSAMVVNNMPAAITGTNTVCVAATQTYANTVSGGTWSSSDAGTATVSTGGVVTGVATGSATITYTVGGCYVTRAITVNVTPAAIAGSTSVCISTPATLTNSVAGGTWSRTNGTGTANITSGGVVSGLSAGTVTISYTIGSCRATYGITVNTAPATISGSNSICRNATTVYTNTVSGGSWSSSNATIASVDALGNVTGINTGTATISYTTGSCYVTKNITVNVAPDAISGSSVICNGTSTTLTNAVTGGTWSRTNGTGTASIGGTTGLVTGTAAGTVTISYTIGSCRSTFPITVSAAPATITGSNAVCQGLTTLFANTVTGGVWSSGSAVATVDTTGNVHGVSVGSATITYSIGTCTATKAITVNVSPASITGANVVCSGTSTTLSDSVSGGTWSRTNGTGAGSINTSGVFTGSTAGTVTVSYSIGTCRATMGITVSTAPAALTGTNTICQGATTVFANTVGGGTWASSNSATATVNGTGTITGVGAGAATITYAIGSCQVTRGVTVNIAPGAISGAATVCTSSTTTLSNPVSGGTWARTNGTGTGSVGATTGIVTGSTAGTITISYSIGSCRTSWPMTIIGVPAVITGNNILCATNSTTLTNTTANGSWSSSNNSVASVNIAGSVTGVAAGAVTITYATGCGTPATKAVTVYSMPSATITTGTAPCTGHSTAVNFNGTSGDTVTYTVDGGANINARLTGGFYSVSTGVVTGSHTYLLVNAHNAVCTTAIGSSITVSPVAMQWVGGTAGNETNWNTASNWSCNTVPSVTDNVSIPAGTAFPPAVPLTGIANVGSLAIADGAVVTINNSAILNVKNGLVNNGSVTGDGVLSLSGSVPQSISGIGKIDHLKLGNSAGAAIAPVSRVTIVKSLTVDAGTFTTSDSLVLASDSVATARVGQMPVSGAAISGNVRVMQYIPGGFRRYRFWSQPFSTYIPLAQIQQYIDITGRGGAANGFTPTTTNAASAFRYDPALGNSAAGYDPGWREFTSTYETQDSNRLHQYQGIRIYIRGAKGQGLDGASYVPAPVTISMKGPLNQGLQTITMAKGTGTNQDYNMVGNPYASPVDIGTVIYNARTAGNITGTAFYVFNPYLGAAGQYQAIPIDGTPYYIQPYTCFQVRAAHNGDTLRFTEANKSAVVAANLLRESNESVTLNVYDANYHLFDALKVQFNDQATDKEDNDFDAGKPSGLDFSFYSLSAEGNNLTIDNRPYGNGKVIPLGIVSRYAQEYIIRAEGFNVPSGGKLYLHDKLLNKVVALHQGAEYRFTVDNNKATQGNNRFELSTMPDAEADANTARLQVNIAPNPVSGEVSISCSIGAPAQMEVSIHNIAGIRVYSNTTAQSKNGIFRVNMANLPAGIYMVEVSGGGQKVVQKIVKD